MRSALRWEKDSEVFSGFPPNGHGVFILNSTCALVWGKGNTMALVDVDLWSKFVCKVNLENLAFEPLHLGNNQLLPVGKVGFNNTVNGILCYHSAIISLGVIMPQEGRTFLLSSSS
jgi:hypothetical protein